MKKWMLTFFFCVLGTWLSVDPVSAQEDQNVTVWPSGEMTLQEAYEKTPAGGTLRILRGEHSVPETLVVRKDIKILGENAEDCTQNVLLGGSENVLRLESGFAEIKNLTLKNTGDSESPRAPEKSAVQVCSPSSVFENCHFVSASGNGFSVVQKDAAPTVTRCTAKGCGNGGFFIAGGAKGNFTECESSGNTAFGISVREPGTEPTVEKCRFIGTAKGSGILVLDGARGTFKECESSRNARTGIQIAGNQTDPTVTLCRFLAGKGDGILVLDGARGTFTGCESSGNVRSGITVRKAGPTVDKSQFTQNQQAGIETADGAFGIFRECESSRNRKYGFMALNRGTEPVVLCCRFSENGQSGIYVCSGARGEFRECESVGSHLAGIEICGAGTDPSVLKCRFTDTFGNGIYVYSEASGTFSKCESSGNADGIVVLYAGTDPTVKDCRIEKNIRGIVLSENAEGTFRNNTLAENEKGDWFIHDSSSPARIGNSPNTGNAAEQAQNAEKEQKKNAGQETQRSSSPLENLRPRRWFR
ncbi:MAG: right-handed parallel beta-helix repeat-containing protein [Thermoguttaceae bacterium]|nr:right-handed parallel beta-helix repeat-containing protein [Thermoguttaceae bacterium]